MSAEPELHVGTSGWAYKEWKPDFYPKELSPKKLLEFYASRLNSVEVNFTFRQQLRETTADSWIQSVPDGFQFSIKAYQSITHFRRLKNTSEPLERFLTALVPFHRAKKLGVVLFQLPSNMRCDLLVLSEFVKGLPKSFRYTFEFREASWLNDGVYDCLRAGNIAMCVTEGTAELSTPDIQTADFSYYRLRRVDYSKAKLKKVAKELRDAKRSENFIYFKHENSAAGAMNGILLADYFNKGE